VVWISEFTNKMFRMYGAFYWVWWKCDHFWERFDVMGYCGV